MLIYKVGHRYESIENKPNIKVSPGLGNALPEFRIHCGILYSTYCPVAKKKLIFYLYLYFVESFVQKFFSN